MQIEVHVKPNSKKTEISEQDSILRVSLKSPAQDGKANLELLKLLRKHFGKPVEIIRGRTSKKKIIRVTD